jgi:hypothetical protein
MGRHQRRQLKLVIEGDGVVGECPRLTPGTQFHYQSYHLIASDSVAEGAYLGQVEDGERVFTRIPPFQNGNALLPARSPGTGSSPFPAPTARTPTFFISKAGSGASSGITRTGPARPTPIPARFSSTPFRKMTRCRKKSARNSEAAALPRNSTAREIIISRWRLPAAAGNSRSKISNDLRVERICNLTIPEVAIIINGIQAFR